MVLLLPNVAVRPFAVTAAVEYPTADPMTLLADKAKIVPVEVELEEENRDELSLSSMRLVFAAEIVTAALLALAPAVSL
jgi:hypothetical protein